MQSPTKRNVLVDISCQISLEVSQLYQAVLLDRLACSRSKQPSPRVDTCQTEQSGKLTLHVPYLLLDHLSLETVCQAPASCCNSGAETVNVTCAVSCTYKQAVA